jgi:hypothetical protein
MTMLEVDVGKGGTVILQINNDRWRNTSSFQLLGYPPLNSQPKINPSFIGYTRVIIDPLIDANVN